MNPGVHGCMCHLENLAFSGNSSCHSGKIMEFFHSGKMYEVYFLPKFKIKNKLICRDLNSTKLNFNKFVIVKTILVMKKLVCYLLNMNYITF